jgi:hypothetical protein
VPFEIVDRIADVASVALISLATVLSAWGGYQSARWNGVQMRHYSQAQTERIRASAASNLTNARQNLDAGLFLFWADAYANKNQELMDFLYRRFPPHLLAAFDAWTATKPLKNPHAPSSPFVMPQYRLQSTAETERANQAAANEFEQAQAANQQSDDYVLFTVFFASITFIGGISTKLRYPMSIIILAVGLTFFLILCVRLIRSPVL